MRRIVRMVLPVVVLLAFTWGTGTAHASFKRGIGARAMGMGQAFTAVADDASAAYWNPAALGDLDGYHLLTTHDDLSFDRNFDYVGLTLPDSLGGTLGVGWQRFTISGISQYDTNRNYLGTFDATEDMLTLSFGRRLTKWMSIGANMKYFSQKLLSSYRGSGFGFDMSLMFNMHKQFDMGLVLQDVGGNMKWKNTANEPEYEVPLSIRLGTAWRPRDNILFALDLEKEENLSVRTNYGVEAWFRERFGVRAGSNNGDFNIGASLVLGRWQFDYAYMSHDLGEINRISARVRIDDMLSRESPRALQTPATESSPYGPPVGTEIDGARVVEVPPVLGEPAPEKPLPAIGEKWVEYTPDTVPVEKKTQETAESLYEEANKLLNLKQYVRAIECFKKALAVNPYFTDCYRKLGVIYQRRKMYEESIRAYEQALYLEPDSPYIHISLGDIYERVGMRDKAILQYEKAIELEPVGRVADIARKMIEILK